MRKIISINLLLLPILFFSQVIIGPGKTMVTNNSVSLEFGDTENKGIVLPYVTSENDVTNAEDGTLILDTADRKVKVKANGNWENLSNAAETTNAIDTSIQNNTDLASAKVSIGTSSTPAEGILVLEDTDKAMILPRVAEPHKNIINPAAGMMVYDTTNKMLVVFNGTQWSFWKED